jgi:acetyl-CoA carboxylase biotin carboxyl carrier protein
MELDDVKSLIELMEKYKLSELEVEKEGLKIRLKKEGEPQQVLLTERPLTAMQGVSQVGAPAPSMTGVEIKAPMVGTFYRSPSPEAPPFVEAGQVVEIGQVVCIIEAMKLMNEIKSELKGKILEVQVENGEPVEFGQPLFRVEPL